MARIGPDILRPSWMPASSGCLCLLASQLVIIASGRACQKQAWVSCRKRAHTPSPLKAPRQPPSGLPCGGAKAGQGASHEPSLRWWGRPHPQERVGTIAAPSKLAGHAELMPAWCCDDPDGRRLLWGRAPIFPPLRPDRCFPLLGEEGRGEGWEPASRAHERSESAPVGARLVRNRWRLPTNRVSREEGCGQARLVA